MLAERVGGILAVIGGLIALVAFVGLTYLMQGTNSVTGLQVVTGISRVATAGNLTSASAPFLWWWGVPVLALLAIALGLALTFRSRMPDRSEESYVVEGRYLAAGLILIALVCLLVVLPYPLVANSQVDFALSPAGRQSLLDALNPVGWGFVWTVSGMLVVLIGGVQARIAPEEPDKEEELKRYREHEREEHKQEERERQESGQREQKEQERPQQHQEPRAQEQQARPQRESSHEQKPPKQEEHPPKAAPGPVEETCTAPQRDQPPQATTSVTATATATAMATATATATSTPEPAKPHASGPPCDASSPSGKALRLAAAGRTEQGRRQIEEGKPNQDCCYVPPGESPSTTGLFIVADGLGGHPDGEVASGLAVTTMRAVLQPLLAPSSACPTEEEFVARLCEAINYSNEVIWQCGGNHPDKDGRRAASTVTAALVVDGRAYIANVGDSRTYLLRAQTLEQITRDHAVNGRLTRALGTDETLKPAESDRPYSFTQQLQIGDALLLCSDGLWGKVSTEEMTAIVTSEHDANNACELLIRQAKENGGQDDITAVLVRCIEVRDTGR